MVNDDAGGHDYQPPLCNVQGCPLPAGHLRDDGRTVPLGRGAVAEIATVGVGRLLTLFRQYDAVCRLIAGDAVNGRPLDMHHAETYRQVRAELYGAERQ